MKKLLSLLLALVLVFGGVVGLMLAHPQPVKAAASYYVNDDSTAGDVYCTAVGNDASDGMSPATPKRTVQAIINTYDLEAGDTVYVDAGTYAEHVVIGAADSGLTLQGAGTGLTSVNGSATGLCLFLDALTQGTIDGFTITNGGASAHSGGMYIDHSANITVSNCTFSGNTANYGGGMGIILSTNTTITSCTFSGNIANHSGGGMEIAVSTNTTITSCIFSGNSAPNMGGGIFNTASSPIIINCIFSGNTAQVGGGMHNTSLPPPQPSPSPVITNCTFSGNIATSSGGGIWNDPLCTTTATNCIFWGNSNGELFGHGYSVSYSDVQGEYAGKDNINQDPLFVSGGDFHLKSQGGHWTSSGWVIDIAHSPCIDAGDPASAFSNEPAPNGGRINMGAYGNTVQASKTPLPEINLKQGVTDIADGGSYDFGSHLLNTNTDVIFTIENTGTGDLNLITPLTISGADAGQFSIQTQPTSPVAPSGSITFVVRFTPTSVGAKTATISIANNDSDENPYDLTIQGNATAPEINLKECVSDIADGDSYDFGSQLLSTDTDITFTIENTGTGDLTLTTPLTIGGADAGQFSIQTQPTSPVAPSGSITFVVRFTPTSVGTKTATISISNNDSDENPYDFTITGTGFREEEDEYHLRMNLLGTTQRVHTSYSGKLEQTLEVTSADDTLTVTIPMGTVAKQKNGNRLTTLSVSENDNPPPPPENKNIIGLTYNFEPDGATFDPAITLTFTYDPETLPEGIEEEDLVLAFYDEGTGKWIELECVVDTENHTITASVSHFTDFAIIAPIPPPPPAPQPEPDPAAFSLSKLTIQPLEVEPEEMVTISVSVTNTGGTKGSYTVVLNVNDIEEQRQSISVAAGGTEQVDFTFGKEVPGDYSIKIGSLEGIFTVMVPEEPAETPVEEVPQQPELPTEPPVPTEKGGINWYIIGTILGIAILLAIFIPIWIRRRRVS